MCLMKLIDIKKKKREQNLNFEIKTYRRRIRVMKKRRSFSTESTVSARGRLGKLGFLLKAEKKEFKDWDLGHTELNSLPVASAT